MFDSTILLNKIIANFGILIPVLFTGLILVLNISFIRKLFWGTLIFFIIQIFLPFYYSAKVFTKAVNDYEKGEVKIAIGSGGDNWSYKLHPKFRVKSYIGFDCSPDVTDNKSYGNNLGLKYMFSKYGYQKYTYTGYYPTEEEIINTLEKESRIIKVKIDYDNGFIEFKVNGITKKVYMFLEVYLDNLKLKLKKDIDRNEIINYLNLRIDDSKSNFVEIKAIQIKECIILKEVKYGTIYLIESNKGLAFAEYNFDRLKMKNASR